MRAFGLICITALVALLVAPTMAAGRAVHLTCRDGVPAPFPGVCASPLACPTFCDRDRACDGVCTFRPFVLGSATRVCFDSPCQVPVGEKRVMRVTVAAEKTEVVLRCRRHPHKVPCPTTTTTINGFTTTTTTLVPVTCSRNADCPDTGNPCVVSPCSGGMCQQLCVCMASLGRITCAPAEAIHCPSPDCHALIGDPCVHCDENDLCVTIPFCE